ncbi:hypothetical protein Ae717Ps2_5968 [Pseudonocardia sp. Ae717_Ps2]|uniref:GntR family transcriptional regulator n=1 Tax=Pseudonocardia sp. Ae717_Ps2 TaxID=1885573 RepID=UPI00096488E5|nr:GntR family transcriptional regulator [Pseudonocardia sp. Ae717_Ps2]OLM28849.1 hypothetical protein Ae717Ps2_5968 [Pseudonocardia sp. Ae717_Ps2]
MARKYEKIARELRERITNGTYPPGSTLPALPELMATYEVARETVAQRGCRPLPTRAW